MRRLIRLFSFFCIVAFYSGGTLDAQENLSWDIIETPATLANQIQFFGAADNNLYLQTFQQGLMRLPTNEENGQWQAFNATEILSDTYVMRIVALPDGGRVLLTSAGLFRAQAGSDIFVKFGADISTFPHQNFFYDMFVDADGNWYAATAIGIMFTDDQAESWTKVLDIEEAYRIRELADGSLLVAAGRIAFGNDVTQAAGLWRSDAARQNWEADLYADEETFTIRDLAVTSGGQWFVAAQSETSTITTSDDEGENWSYTLFGDIATSIIALNNDNILASAANSGVALSTDGGQTWPRFNQGLQDPRILYLTLHNDRHAYCADVFGNVYRSSEPVQPVTTDLALADNQTAELHWTFTNGVLTVESDLLNGINAALEVSLFDLRGLHTANASGVATEKTLRVQFQPHAPGAFVATLNIGGRQFSAVLLNTN